MVNQRAPVNGIPFAAGFMCFKARKEFGLAVALNREERAMHVGFVGTGNMGGPDGDQCPQGRPPGHRVRRARGGNRSA